MGVSCLQQADNAEGGGRSPRLLACAIPMLPYLSVGHISADRSRFALCIVVFFVVIVDVVLVGVI